MRLLAKNLMLGLALVAVPLFAEGVATLQAQPPGTGVKVLLYWPLEFGLIVLALAAFIFLNAYGLRKRPSGVILGAFAAIPATAIWFGFAFLVVFQVHLWRGGLL